MKIVFQQIQCNFSIQFRNFAFLVHDAFLRDALTLIKTSFGRADVKPVAAAKGRNKTRRSLQHVGLRGLPIRSAPGDRCEFRNSGRTRNPAGARWRKLIGERRIYACIMQHARGDKTFGRGPATERLIETPLGAR